MKKLIIFILFFCISSNANELPDLGSTFDNLITHNDEKKIKFQILQQVYSSNSVIDDIEINDYIASLGEDLVLKGTSEKPSINFFLVNDQSVNAFAMLGNIIGVHSGLIFAANNESELASVLSHEIAHLTQKHLLRLFHSQANNSFKTYLSIAVAILAARSNPQLAQGALIAGQASQVQNLLNFTRDNEREADRIGLQILDKAGYDPRGFIDFFKTLDSFNQFTTGAAPAFLRTHPITTERISDIQDRLKIYQYFQRENKIEFYFIKSKLKALIGEYSSISEIFMNEIKDKRYLNENAALFGLIYSLIRQNRIKEARSYFNDFKKNDLKSPMIIELEANLLIKENKYQDAFETYKKGINEYPYYRAFIYGISKLMLQSKKPEKTIELLNSFLPYFKKDPIIYNLLARAYNQKGNYLMEHENLSDAYYHQFDIQSAITQMDLAVKTTSENFFDKSRVEHRLNELKREAELMKN